MTDFIKPDTTNEEIILDPNRFIMSKMDKDGVLEFANEYFMEVSGYEEYELMGRDIFCVQHPDMPKVIFKMMWEKLLQKENFQVVVKNIAKSGKYYWSVTNFTFKLDENTNDIIAIYSKRKGASPEAKAYFSKLYKTLVKIEGKSGIEIAEKYAKNFLENEGLNDFNELMTRFYELEKEISLSKSKTKPISKPTTQQEVNETYPKSISIELTTDKPIQKITEKIIPKFVRSKKIPAINIDTNKEATSKPVTPKESLEQKEVLEEKEVLESNHNKEEKKEGIFQRLFGKTPEEIEEERLRNEKKNKE